MLSAAHATEKRTRLLGALVSAALVGLCCASMLGAEPHKDGLGDPLPEGAIARLGTARLFHPLEIKRLVFSPDAKRIASSGTDGTIRIWQTTDGKEFRRFRDSAPAFAFSADGKTLVTGGFDLQWWDIESGKLVRKRELKQPTENKRVVRLLEMSHDGKRIQTVVTESSEIEIWDYSTGELVDSFKCPDRPIMFCAEGRYVWASANATTHRVWDVTKKKEMGAIRWEGKTIIVNGQPVIEVTPVSASCTGLSVSTDGKWVGYTISGTDRGVIADLRTGKPVHTFKGHHSFWFLPGGLRVMADSRVSGCRIIDAESGKVIRKLAVDNFNFQAVSRDCQLGARCNSSAVFDLWDLSKLKKAVEFEGHGPRSNGFPSSPRTSIRNDSRTVATAGDYSVCIWDAPTGRLLRRFAESNEIHNLCWSPDGKYVATTCDYQYLILWNPETGKERWVTKGDAFNRGSLVFSPDSKYIATCGVDSKRAALWSTETGKEVRRFGPIEKQFYHLAFSHDGKLLVAEVGEKDPIAWESETGKGLSEFDPPEFERFNDARYEMLLRSLTFENARDHFRKPPEWPALERANPKLDQFGRVLGTAPDGRSIFNVRWDTPLGYKLAQFYLHETNTGLIRAEFSGHDAELYNSATFTPDGRYIVTASCDGTVLIWDPLKLPYGRPELCNWGSAQGDSIWLMLASKNAREAYDAMRCLWLKPVAAVALLKRTLIPVAAPGKKELNQLLTDLDADDFKQRVKADRELERLGEVVIPLLQRALALRPTEESRTRIEKLLERILAKRTHPEMWRITRAVEVLERIGSPEARDLLNELASGAENAKMTIEAKGSVARLAARN